MLNLLFLNGVFWGLCWESWELEDVFSFRILFYVKFFIYLNIIVFYIIILFLDGVLFILVGGFFCSLKINENLIFKYWYKMFNNS